MIPILTSKLIFMMLDINVVPMEATPTSYFLISYNEQLKKKADSRTSEVGVSFVLLNFRSWIYVW
jgi:hypothetical protein